MMSKTRAVILWMVACFLFGVCLSVGVGVLFFSPKIVLETEEQIEVVHAEGLTEEEEEEAGEEEEEEG